MKLSKRLQIIANLINENDYVCDVGCDHAFLSIYLAKYKNINVVATEIATGPYNCALNNINKERLTDKIKLYKTDGLCNVKENINTIVIAGMGSSTMIHILNNYNLDGVEKLILQSNKDIDLLRKFVNQKGFVLQKEYYTFENGKDYLTLYCIKGMENLSEDDILCGKYDLALNDYYLSQVNRMKNIIDQMPLNLQSKDNKIITQYRVYLNRINKKS